MPQWVFAVPNSDSSGDHPRAELSLSVQGYRSETLPLPVRALTKIRHLEGASIDVAQIR